MLLFTHLLLSFYLLQYCSVSAHPLSPSKPLVKRGVINAVGPQCSQRLRRRMQGLDSGIHTAETAGLGRGSGILKDGDTLNLGRQRPITSAVPHPFDAPKDGLIPPKPTEPRKENVVPTPPVKNAHSGEGEGGGPTDQEIHLENGGNNGIAENPDTSFSLVYNKDGSRKVITDGREVEVPAETIDPRKQPRDNQQPISTEQTQSGGKNDPPRNNQQREATEQTQSGGKNDPPRNNQQREATEQTQSGGKNDPPIKNQHQLNDNQQPITEPVKDPNNPENHKGSGSGNPETQTPETSEHDLNQQDNDKNQNQVDGSRTNGHQSENTNETRDQDGLQHEEERVPHENAAHPPTQSKPKGIGAAVVSGVTYGWRKTSSGASYLASHPVGWAKSLSGLFKSGGKEGEVIKGVTLDSHVRTPTAKTPHQRVEEPVSPNGRHGEQNPETNNQEHRDSERDTHDPPPPHQDGQVDDEHILQTRNDNTRNPENPAGGGENNENYAANPYQYTTTEIRHNGNGRPNASGNQRSASDNRTPPESRGHQNPSKPQDTNNPKDPNNPQDPKNPNTNKPQDRSNPNSPNTTPTQQVPKTKASFIQRIKSKISGWLDNMKKFFNKIFKRKSTAQAPPKAA